jgi:hypothetical protein
LIRNTLLDLEEGEERLTVLGNGNFWHVTRRCRWKGIEVEELWLPVF